MQSKLRLANGKIQSNSKQRSCLVRVGQAAHAAHHTQHVVVHGVDTHLGRQSTARRHRGAIHHVRNGSLQGARRQRQVQHGIVDAREVARAAGLVLLGLQGKGVHVDTHARASRVVLVGLHEVEVGAEAGVEPVVAVQLDLGHSGRVGARVVAVIEGQIMAAGGPVVAVNIRIQLGHPHQLLHGVVEGHLDVVLGGRHGLTARELELLDQVLVGHLGETATLLSVQVHVVGPQRGSHQAGVVHGIVHLLSIAGSSSGTRHNVAQVVQVGELHVHLHLVVLQSNQRQSQTRVTAEPELQRHVQSVLGGTPA